MKSLRPLFLFAGLLLVVSLACNALTNSAPTQPSQPEQPVQPAQPVEQPTQPEAPAPTATMASTEAPVAAPTETSAPVVSKFYTEEFNDPLSSNWDSLTVTGSASADPDKVNVETSGGKLVWDFGSEYVYYYLFYNAYNYDDVEVSLSADNRGRNNNSISLICRYDPQVGWYEFNIANNGLYTILYGEVTSSGDIQYSRIANGGSNNIKQGKAVNEYSISCKGDKLSLTINGKEIKSITEKNYGLREGQVGVSVSSFNVLPILVEMDWFKISQP